MNHVHEDQLLLLAYGELAEADAAAAERHLAGCAECRARLTTLERAAVAYDLAMPQRRRVPLRWIAAGLAAAAALIAVLVMRREPVPSGDRSWPPPAVWSTTAGYVAGGTHVVEIDVQLTRLEQERYHGLPH